MVKIDTRERTAAIWAAAIREAAPVFSSYLTPLGYSLGSFAVRGVEPGTTALSAEVAARLDLGRAYRVAGLLQRLDAETNSTYRHELVYSQGYVRGKPHVPRYLQMLARGDPRGVPVMIAQRQPATPENLFVSEAVRVSRLVCDSWMLRDSAEQQAAIDLAERFGRFEARTPWSALRGHPRPSLGELSGIVAGRVTSGIVDGSGAVAELQELFPPRESRDSAGFEECEGILALMACDDPRFEDKVFELLVLAWLLDSLGELANAFRLDLRVLKGAAGRPIATATFGNAIADVFFQSGAAILPAGHWAYRHSGSPLRAIPDIVIRRRSLDEAHDERFIIVDAKNRGVASESEVAYKLLGYQENLRINQYAAVGVYPSLRGRGRLRRLSDGTSTVTLAHIPLRNGHRTVKRIVRALA